MSLVLAVAMPLLFAYHPNAPVGAYARRCKDHRQGDPRRPPQCWRSSPVNSPTATAPCHAWAGSKPSDRKPITNTDDFSFGWAAPQVSLREAGIAEASFAAQG
jgi:hypothetical protein